MKNNFFNLEGKHIVITGASSGIGRAVAILLSNYGVKLTLIARRQDELENTQSQLLNKLNHIILPLDISKFELIDSEIGKAVEKNGQIYGFVHCAGIDIVKPLSITKANTYQQIFDINVISAFEMVKIMSKKKYVSEIGGSFIFISSIAALYGQATKTAYSSSKGALIAGMKSIAIELAPKSIRVNTISPAVVETEMSNTWISQLSKEQKDLIVKNHPLGLGNVLDIANSCLFLLSDASKWITGTNLIVDGGFSC